MRQPDLKEKDWCAINGISTEQATSSDPSQGQWITLIPGNGQHHLILALRPCLSRMEMRP